MKKSKIRKILISFIISICMGIMILPNMSNAANKVLDWDSLKDGMKNDKVEIGDHAKITMHTEQSENDARSMYCTEYLEGTPYHTEFTIVNILDIVGKTSTGKGTNGKTLKITSKSNAKLAYILSLENQKGAVKRRHQVAIWAYLPTWKKYVGNEYSKIGNGFMNNNHPTITEKVDDILDAAQKYADTVTTELTYKDNTDASKLKAKNIGEDTIIGPFNWEFTGKIDKAKIAIYCGDKKLSGVKFGKLNSKKEWETKEIKSKTNFYVSIPSANLTKGKLKIKVKSNTDVKATRVYFLKQTSGDAKQNLITYVNRNETLEKEWEDLEYSIQGNLKVIKVDKDNNVMKLKDVGFLIQNKATGKYVNCDSKGNIKYVEKDKATEFTTDEKGEIEIKNLIIGKYVAYETKNPNVGYEIVNDKAEKAVTIDKTAELKIENEKTTIALSGYVWVDKVDGKGSLRNDRYREGQDDNKDELLAGITVKLIDKTTGQVVKNKSGNECIATTDSTGKYTFNNVLIKDLKNYYIQFEYNGLTYTNVAMHKEVDNGSKAVETEADRKALNAQFKTVTAGKTIGEDGKEHKTTYNYNQEEHKSTLASIDANIAMNAKTENSYVYDRYQELLNKNNNKPVNEITFINLGLKEREQPDVALVKDLQNVKLSINGFNHVYNYASRFNNIDNGNYDGSGFNVGVKFGSEYNSQSYTRAIYKADYDYTNDDKSKELKVKITYRIAMRNESTNLTAKVNNIVDYFDSRYSSTVKVGTLNPNNGEVVGKEYTASNYNNNYKKVVIDTNAEIKPQQLSNIYVQFELTDEATIGLLNNKTVLDNVAEINSYSITDKTGNLYAGIDIDSAPGNCVPGEVATYEDDTDKAPGLLLDVQDELERTISGTVFEDNNGLNVNIDPGQAREGNGKIDDGEQKIQGVTVRLKDSSGKYFGDSTTTDKNGNFTFTGFPSGIYTIEYEWGEECGGYKVTNYKGTIYKEDKHHGNLWWKDVSERLSDAKDDWDRRQQIDAEGNPKTMISTTASMDLGIEEGDSYKITGVTTLVDEDKFRVGQYKIENIDFGIIERPRQEITMDKRVSHIKITLPNGQVLEDTDVNEDGTFKNGNTALGPFINTTQGTIWAEMDNELIQGSKLDVTYSITAKNISERDFMNQNYYWYGENSKDEKNPVTISATGINDYLDKEFAYDEAANSDWTIVREDENTSKEQIINTIPGTDDWEQVGDSIETEAGVVTKYKKKNAGTETTTETSWKYVVQSSRQSEIDDETILKLKTEAVSEFANIKAGENATVKLNVSKVLANADEIELGNKAEITQINVSNGREPILSKTFDDAEMVTVTPNTGENRNYIMPIILGTSLLVILGAGVVLIKKKVLNK